ncbi:MAG: hypothetical protein P4L27_01850 [Ignavibacteriaceae bacterium]|nr:hypothetical protein [Ignavibacteriaceae bacterium]
MKNIFAKIAVSVISILLFAGWGSTGHKIINQNITVCFPSSMNFPSYWSDTLTAHASDADTRKSSDPSESPKHFIDIDNYSEFISNGYISQSYDTNVIIHGSAYVVNEGTLPWAIQWTVDSLRIAFLQKNWHKAMLFSADLGHYVGDGHQPLHITQNYDGQLTGQSGVHSRYETTLVGQYQSSIVYSNNKASYVSNISNYVFDFIYLDHKYVDSVLNGDKVATAYAGRNSGTTYLQKYWELCGSQTILLMKNASKSVADLIYTAWVDAGSPDPNGAAQVTLSLTALIQGLYNGTLMVSDSVTVELHNSASPYALVDSKKGILNTAGTGTFSFSTAVNGTPYFIVIKHRNAVETWSASAQSFTSNTLNYDFTTSQAKAYGGNLVLKGTKLCLYSGDINHDGLVDLSDLLAEDNDNLSAVSGYVVTDLNGDGLVDLSDLLIADNNNTLAVSKSTP